MLDLKRAPRTGPPAALALALAAALLAPSSGHADEEAPSAEAGTAPATAMATAPAKGTPAKTGPEIRLERERRTWPTVLVWAAGGVTLAGTGVALGAYTSQLISLAEMQAMKPTRMKRRCERATPECFAYADARAASERAFEVVLWSLSVSTAVAGGLWGIAVVGEVTSPVKVEVVPTVGGALLHGTF